MLRSCTPMLPPKEALKLCAGKCGSFCIMFWITQLMMHFWCKKPDWGDVGASAGHEKAVQDVVLPVVEVPAVEKACQG